MSTKNDSPFESFSHIIYWNCSLFCCQVYVTRSSFKRLGEQIAPKLCCGIVVKKRRHVHSFLFVNLCTYCFFKYKPFIVGFFLSQKPFCASIHFLLFHEISKSSIFSLSSIWIKTLATVLRFAWIEFPFWHRTCVNCHLSFTPKSLK